MGQKVNPIGFRLQITEEWRSRWYASKKDFGKLLEEDWLIRDTVKKKLFYAGVPKIEIERAGDKLRVIVYTARPGLVIGRKGAEIDRLKEDLAELTGRGEITIDPIEVKKPEIEAQLVAENIALQLERRVAYRRAIKKAVQTGMNGGAKGIKVIIGGRLGGAEIARTEVAKEGSIPLHTLRAKIDYGFTVAQTTYGTIGVRVWIYKGEDISAKNKKAGGMVEPEIKETTNAVDAQQS